MKPSGIQLLAELDGCPSGLLDNEALLKKTLVRGIKTCGLHKVSLTSHKFNPIGVTVISIISESHIAIHTYPEANHASVDIFHCSTDSHRLIMLLDFLKKKLKARTVKFAKILRGRSIRVGEMNAVHSSTRYGFDVVYHYDRKVVEKKSRFQDILIVENSNFGRILFLDGDMQLSDADVDIYNRAMVEPVLNGNNLGRVAILGGGDGGVLKELLKHKPKKATLVDLDGDVVKISRKYLKKVCGGAFSNPRTEIIIDDANNFLNNNGKLDAVIYDLTANPESLTIKSKHRFLNDMFYRIRGSLKNRGRLSMQCCSEFDRETFRLVNTVLKKYFSNIKFRKVFIPSFCEPWIFASAKAK
jgi:S-adenosylmethionine decarboxylase proenzyme